MKLMNTISNRVSLSTDDWYEADVSDIKMITSKTDYYLRFTFTLAAGPGMGREVTLCVEHDRLGQWLLTDIGKALGVELRDAQVVETADFIGRRLKLKIAYGVHDELEAWSLGPIAPEVG